MDKLKVYVMVFFLLGFFTQVLPQLMYFFTFRFLWVFCVGLINIFVCFFLGLHCFLFYSPT